MVDARCMSEDLRGVGVADSFASFASSGCGWGKREGKWWIRWYKYGVVGLGGLRSDGM